MSSANQGLPRPSLPKSVSAAISVHTTGTTSTINLPKQSVIMPSTTHTASSNLGNIITVAASSGSQSVYNPQNPGKAINEHCFYRCALKQEGQHLQLKN